MTNNKPSIKIGDTFKSSQGELCVVVNYISCSRILIRFSGSSSFERYVRADHLRSGSFNNPFYRSVCGVGFLGVGEHKTRQSNKKTAAYQCWNDMMKRCYNESVQKKHPTYIGCRVDDDWHSFQNFAEWFNDNYIEGYHLDKDILVRGNKLYSAETCCLVPRKINNLFLDCGKTRGLYPIGVSRNIKTGRFVSELNVDGEPVILGYFDCYKEAHNKYVSAKEANVKRTALEWQHRIDSRVFDVLMVWTVSPFGE